MKKTLSYRSGHFFTAQKISSILACFMALSVSSYAADKLQITGAGSTFAYPLYSKWSAEFKKAHPETEINYQSIGSGAGIRQFTDRTVDFGASDNFMTDEQIAKAGRPVIHVPTALGAVVLAYNLPGNPQIKLNPDTIAAIFMGKVKTWNDPMIAKLNPSLKLEKALPISAIYRSDGSGTTAVFTDYLSKTNAEWKSSIGTGTAVKWPSGIGAKGNEGVTGMIRQAPGAIGYVELTFAATNKIPYASVQNAAGAFIEPAPKSITEAASHSLAQMPADFRVSITNAPGKTSYPISSFTFALISLPAQDEKTKRVVQFLNWGLTEGQKLTAELHYAPIPQKLAAQVKAKLKQ